MRKTQLLVLLAGITMMPSQARDLSPADRDAVIQQQQQLLEQNKQQREDLMRAIQPAPLVSQAKIASHGPCFSIIQITINNTTLLSEKTKARIIRPYLNQCLGMPQITQLVRDISDWYISRGFITSRAFLTEQDLSSGQLTLTVMEGKLQQIRLVDTPARTLKMAFPQAEGQILNLRDIEQGMEQINRLRSVPVQIEILPGDKPGYSIVNLTATPEFPVSASLSFDNSGQKSTGTGQLSGSLTANNPLGLADQWFISGGRSSDFASSHDAQNVQAGVSVPYGYGLLDYSYSWNNYLSTISSQGYDWRSTGDSQTHRLSGSWVVYRNSELKTALSLGVTHRINRNYLNDAPLKSSSRKLSSISGGINHSQKLLGGSITFNPSLTRGVPWFGAEDDTGKSSGIPKAEFTKWGISASYAVPITQRLSYLSSAYGQYSADRLYGSERLTIGGESSVRGFKEQYLAGDNGGYWRNELNQTLFSHPLLGQIGAIAALDGGWLKHDRDDPWASGTLWGAAVGITNAARWYSSQLTLGIPLAYPDWLAPDHLSLNYRIALAF